MANETLKIDENTRWTLGGVTNDADQEIRNARINPVTGRLVVEANVTSTNTQIGSTIPGGTAGSVLFLGLGSTLDEDNANFFYDSTSHFLGIGNNAPTANLHVTGSFRYVDGNETNGYVLTSDANGNASWQVSPASLGYSLIQDNGVSLTQRTTLNFVNYFTVTDGSGKTNVSINVTELETALSLQNIGGLLDLSTQVSGLLSSTYIDISDLEATLDLANISGQIDLATQVTGQLDAANIDQASLDLSMIGGDLDLTTQVGTSVLPLANGGTGENLSDPGYDAAFVWDNTTNETRLAQLSGLSYNSGTNTLTASGGGSGTKVAIDTTGGSIPSGGSGTFYTQAIAGGILGTNNQVRFRLAIYGLNLQNGDTLTINAAFGGGTASLVISNASGGSISGAPVSFDGEITATGATNTQTMTTRCTTWLNNAGAAQFRGAIAACTADSTISNNLVLTYAGTGNANAAYYWLEVDKVD